MGVRCRSLALCKILIAQLPAKRRRSLDVLLVVTAVEQALGKLQNELLCVVWVCGCVGVGVGKFGNRRHRWRTLTVVVDATKGALFEHLRRPHARTGLTCSMRR
jgi:hypothetical protein